MTAETKTTEEAVGGCAVALGMMALSVVTLAPLRAWVLMTIWRWYAVRDFGARPLTWHAALGLSLIVAYLTLTIPKKSDESTPGYTYWMSLGLTLAGLFFGWLYHVITRGWG